MMITRWFGTHRRGFLAWLLVIGLSCLMYASMFHSVRDLKGDAIKNMPKAYQDAFNLSDISTGPSYIQGTVTGFIGLILLSIAAIGWASNAIAGDEESGDLALTLAHGISRTNLYWSRVAAVTGALTLIAASIAGGIIAMTPGQGLGITTGNALAGTFAMLVLVLMITAVGWLIGAITGRRNHALLAGAAALVVSWVTNSLGSQAGLSWLRRASPMSWAFGQQPLKQGADWGALVAMLAITAVCLVLGWWVFQRRDVQG